MAAVGFPVSAQGWVMPAFSEEPFDRVPPAGHEDLGAIKSAVRARRDPVAFLRLSGGGFRRIRRGCRSGIQNVRDMTRRAQRPLLIIWVAWAALPTKAHPVHSSAPALSPTNTVARLLPTPNTYVFARGGEVGALHSSHGSMSRSCARPRTWLWGGSSRQRGPAEGWVGNRWQIIADAFCFSAVSGQLIGFPRESVRGVRGAPGVGVGHVFCHGALI